MSGLSMKNTKSEMIEKYNELLSKIKDADNKNTDVKRQAQLKEKEKIVNSAKELVDMNILNEVITKKYNDLNEAIEIQNNKLKELFDIEAEAFSLIALINAHNEKKEELEKDYTDKLDELSVELKDKKEAQVKELAKLNTEKQEIIIELNKKETLRKEELKQARKRDEEEYIYNLERTKKSDEDIFSDKKTCCDKEIAQAKKELDDKVKLFEEKEKEFAQLKTKVEEIPKLVEETEKKGATEKEKSLGKEYGYQKTMYQKEKEYEVKALNDKIAMIEEANQRLIDEKQELTDKLDSAYVELKLLATEAVKSTGGIKILNSNNESTKK
ncbi:MAG: hypothetical protein ACRC6T_09320 [Sarcina sp.]